MKKSKNNQTPEEQIIPLVGDKVFTTTDLGIAAALLTANFELLTLDRAEPRKIKFVFERKNGIAKVAEDFWSNRLEQRVRSYWDNVKTLKNRLYSNE